MRDGRISRASPDWPYVDEGARIDAGSLATHRLAAWARVLVYSHGVHDVPGLDANRRAFRVRLGHGMTALKRKHFRSVADERRFVERMGHVGLITVASPMDEAFTLEWGVKPTQIAVTGLPRWDRLCRLRQKSSPRRVIYAPTWRSWTQPDIAARRVTDLLRDPVLRDLCRSTQNRLTLYCHTNMRSAIDSNALVNAGVDICDSDREFPELLADCSVLISDYSSTCWDALYVDIPVVFYMFDRDSYESDVGSYVDLDSLFGWSAFSQEAAIDSIDKALTRVTGYLPNYSTWQARAFGVRDANNSGRVFTQIAERMNGG